MLKSDYYNLPSEVLNHIFSFLKVRDRRNVRLTCCQWYNSCNTISLLQSEKIIINTKNNKDDLWFDVLLNSPRLRFAIEFECISFSENSSVFWEKCGPRIESLRLHLCSFASKSANQMIKSCNNLKKLHISMDESFFFFNDYIQNWDEFKITRESLNFLTLANFSQISDFYFSRLFDIYPCIKKLELINMKINCHKRFDLRFYKGTNIPQFYCDLLFSFSCIYANIKSKAENIKALVLDTICSYGITDDWFENLASLPGLKLEELKLNGHSQLSKKSFLKFFSNQTHLKDIQIDKCRNFSLKCFLHMIQNCSGLECIKVESFDVTPNFSISKEIFLALMLLPSLNILKLKGTFFMEENVSRIAPISAAVFQHLRTLTLNMPAIYYDIFIPKIPCTLSALHLLTKFEDSGLTDSSLQLIFEKWVYLRSLKLSLDPSVSDFGFTGCRVNEYENQTENSGISINRLKRLEKLSLFCNKHVDSLITEISFSHFVFPDLRKLKLSNFSKISEKCFELLCQNIPSVEYCELQKCKIENETKLKINMQWRYLRDFRSL